MAALSHIRPPDTCAKCGACAPVCPVYRVTGREYHTGRGKLQLLEKLDPAAAGPVYAEILSHCLLCGACSRACSRGLPVAELLRQARLRLSRQGGSHHLLRALGVKLPEHSRLLKALSPLARLLLTRRIPTDSGLNLRLALPETWNTGASAPETTIELAPLQQPEPDPPGEIMLFTGCYANFIEPQIARATQSLLQKNRLGRAIIPKDQSCCGLAALSSGQGEMAKRVARKNIEAYSGSSPVVVACASCYHQLKRYPKLLEDDPQWRDQAVDFAARVEEFSKFFQQNLSPSTFGGDLGSDPDSRETAQVRLFYHDPCHLRFADTPITEEPRQLLAMIPQLRLEEAPHGAHCCGHGGLFHLAHPESATAILRQLVDDVKESRAQVITTTCSGCLLHWHRAKALKLHGCRAIHLAVLLDRYQLYRHPPLAHNQ